MSRLKKIVKWIGISVGLLVAILLAINACLVWWTGSQLRAQYAAIRAAGDPVVLSDLARTDIRPEENAVTYLTQARDDLTAVEKELRETTGSGTLDYGELSPARLAQVEAPLASHPSVLPLLEKAAACPHYCLALDYTLSVTPFTAAHLAEVQEIRRAARALRAEGIWLLAHNRRGEAMDRCQLLWRLSRQSDEGAVMVGELVTFACRGTAYDLTKRILQSGPISDDTRRALETELAAQGILEASQRALRNERCYGNSSFKEMPWRSNWIARAYANREEMVYLIMMQRFIGCVEKQGQPLSVFNQVYQQAETDTKHAILAHLMLPALRVYYEACLRTEAQIRCLRVFNALQGRGLEDTEAVPALSELGLPREATLDPYTGQPLIVKRLPEGWLVYSVGRNLRDDGGQLSEDGEGDVGIGPEIPPKP